jgi:hypothetical protein
MRHYIFVMILMFLGVATTSYAQRTRKVHGEYIYHAPENVSLEFLQEIVGEEAMPLG